MRHLPRNIDFNDRDFPELADIFRGIDAEIAAIIASDPAMRAGSGHGPGGSAPGGHAHRKAA